MLYTSPYKRAASNPAKNWLTAQSATPSGHGSKVTVAGLLGQPREVSMVPIYCLPAVVSHAVLAEERAIIRAEGWYHVRGKYIASAPLADNARRVGARASRAQQALDLRLLLRVDSKWRDSRHDRDAIRPPALCGGVRPVDL